MENNTVSYNQCLYPITVNGNTVYCQLMSYHRGNHFVAGPYFTIEWRSELFV